MKDGDMKKTNCNSKGQVWVETVIYTLIAFVMIGLILAFVKPKIEEYQDKATIEQSLSLVNEIDSVVKEIVQRGSGNQREVEMKLNEGTLKISGIGDRIVFEMESRYQYSEPGADYTDGNLVISTEEKGELNVVSITREYSSIYNITYSDEETIKTVSKAPTPYKLLILNKGVESDGRQAINFEVN